jgi:[3-methyl-2-oxobutanoate dehydrogenase (acetyl-transferring)] kinase
MHACATKGYGLGTARVYAKYFGGSLQIVSIYGHGCDVFLRLKNIDLESKDFHI